MAKNTNLSIIESKNLSTQEQRQHHGYRECFDGCQIGGVFGGKGEEVRGLRSTNRQLQNSHWGVKYSIGKGVAKEHICMTHGHEQWCGDCLSEWAVLGVGAGNGQIAGQL